MGSAEIVCVVESGELACGVEWCKDYLGGEVGSEPIAELGVGKRGTGGVPECHKQHSALAVGGLQMSGNFTIERASQSDHYRAPLGKQNVQHSAFYGRVEATHNNFVGFGDLVRPTGGKVEGFGWRGARSKECHQSSIEQVLISG